MSRKSKTLGLSLLLIALSSTFSYSQSKNDKTVIGSVGKEKITYGELKENLRTGAKEEPTLEEMENFLPIYLEYRAKIQFAEKNGIMNDPELVRELELYSKQASYSHWLENRIKETEFEKYFERASTEIKSEHLLIAVSQNAAPSDTLAAYQKLIEARNRFLNGETILELDSEYSTQQNGRSMGGDLPWFSIGTTVEKFEDVIYSLDKGEISMPFRTQFGYHIVHLQDKRERTLSRDVSHIFTRSGNPESKQNIDLAYEKLENGTSWAETAVQLSEDQLSASNGGKIGWVNYGRYDTRFVDSIMELDPNQKYSKPIQTIYGYHIFRIDSVQTFETEQDKRDAYMKEFLNSNNFTKSNSFVIDWLIKEYKSTMNSEELSEIEGFINSKDTVSLENIDYPNSDKEIYKFADYTFTGNDYYHYLKSTHPNAKASSYLSSWFDEFIEYSIDSIITSFTVKEFPSFESTLDNYKKGLAVYQINDTYLWSAATVDTSNLVDIYNSNPEDYSYPKRYYYHMLSALADTTLEKGIKFIESGNHPDSVRSYYPKIAINKDSTGVFTDSPFDRLEQMDPDSFSEKFEYKRRKAVFYLNDILPSRKMTFDEAFNRLLADYQPIREEKWLTELKKNFRIKSDIKKLRSAFEKDDSY
jgi:peptidyl-prolyl cis-trans isomerase SurA